MRILMSVTHLVFIIGHGVLLITLITIGTINLGVLLFYFDFHATLPFMVSSWLISIINYRTREDMRIIIILITSCIATVLYKHKTLGAA